MESKQEYEKECAKKLNEKTKDLKTERDNFDINYERFRSTSDENYNLKLRIKEQDKEIEDKVLETVEYSRSEKGMKQEIGNLKFKLEEEKKRNLVFEDRISQLLEQKKTEKRLTMSSKEELIISSKSLFRPREVFIKPSQNIFRI